MREITVTKAAFYQDFCDNIAKMSIFKNRRGVKDFSDAGLRKTYANAIKSEIGLAADPDLIHYFASCMHD